MSDELFDKTLVFLHKVEQRGHSPEELEALRTAKIALHFIQSIGESYGFEDYLQNFNSEAPPAPLLSFATREEADLWLKSHPAPPHGAVVQIAEARYSVGFERKSGLRVLVRIPSAEELKA
jgi:hypothetical protein